MTENYRPASEPPPWTEPLPPPAPEPPQWTEPLPPPAPEPPQWTEPIPPAPVAPQPAGDQQGTADVVKGQAADLSQSGVEAGKHAVGVAQEQASNVTAEATRQGKDLLRQARGELGEQAAQGQQRLATELLSLSDELTSMAEGSTQNGVAADLARQVASRARDAGQWLDDRRPAQVIDDVQAFARRRPGLFLALAVGTGLVAGRLTRGLAAASSDNDDAAAPAPARQPELGGQWAQPAEDAGYQPGTADTGYQPGTADAGYQPGTADAGYQPGTAFFAGGDRVVNPVAGELPASRDASVWDTDGLSGERDDLGTDRGGREDMR